MISLSKSNIYKKVGQSGWNSERETSRSATESFYDDIEQSEQSTGKKKSKDKKHKRSDHKHDYYKVLIRTQIPIGKKLKNTYSFGNKCSICGKVKDISFYVYDESGHISDEQEILKKFADLEIVDVKFD